MVNRKLVELVKVSFILIAFMVAMYIILAIALVIDLDIIPR